MGLFFILSVPVMTCSPSVVARYAVMNLMAVPAAFMSIVSGLSFRAFTITSVSSQSDRLSGMIPLPASALIIRALLLMLFDAGNFTVQSSAAGAVMMYCIEEFCIYIM